MNILVLTKYPVRGPSSRYRFYQYLPALAESGHHCTVLPFFTDHYLTLLFSGKRPNPLYLAGRFLERMAGCLYGRSFDLVWIEGELFPFMPSLFERGFHLLLPKRRVYEFDDAVWLRYEHKSFLKHKFAKILRNAAGIVVGNAFLEEYVRRFNENTCLVPTVIDRKRYEEARPAHRGNTIGWIGSQATSFYLENLIPVFRTLSETHDVTLKVVGAHIDAEGLTVENAQWSQDSEVALIESFDIGVMPLLPNPWSEGKCGLKLIQYLAAGVPVVASPVGVNRHIIASSRGGYLAEDADAWLAALRKLLDKKALRVEMGQKGREWVYENTSIQAQAPRLTAFLERSAGRSGRVLDPQP